LMNYITRQFRSLNKQDAYDFDISVYLKTFSDSNFIFQVFYDGLTEKEKMQFSKDLIANTNKLKETLSLKNIEIYLVKNYRHFINQKRFDQPNFLLSRAISRIIKEKRNEFLADVTYFNKNLKNSPSSISMLNKVISTIKTDVEKYFHHLTGNKRYDGVIIDDKFSCQLKEKHALTLNFSGFNHYWGIEQGEKNVFQEWVISVCNQYFETSILYELNSSLPNKIDTLLNHHHFANYIEKTSLKDLCFHGKFLDEMAPNYLYHLLNRVFNKELGSFEAIMAIEAIKNTFFPIFIPKVKAKIKEQIDHSFNAYYILIDEALKKGINNLPMSTLEQLSKYDADYITTQRINLILQKNEYAIIIPEIYELNKILTARFNFVLMENINQVIKTRIQYYIDNILMQIESNLASKDVYTLLRIDSILSTTPPQTYDEMNKLLAKINIVPYVEEKGNFLDTSVLPYIIDGLKSKIYYAILEHTPLQLDQLTNTLVTTYFKENSINKPVDAVFLDHFFDNWIANAGYNKLHIQKNKHKILIDIKTFILAKIEFEKISQIFTLLESEINLSYFLKKDKLAFLANRNTLFSIPIQEEYSYIVNNANKHHEYNDMIKLIFQEFVELVQCALDKTLQEESQEKNIELRPIAIKNAEFRWILVNLFNLDSYMINNNIMPLPYIISSNQAAQDIDTYLSKIDFSQYAVCFNSTNRLQLPLDGHYYSDVFEANDNNELNDNQDNDLYFSHLMRIFSLRFKDGDGVILSHFIEKINAIIENKPNIKTPFSIDHCNELLKIAREFIIKANIEGKEIHPSITQIENKIIQAHRFDEITLKDLDTIFNWHFQLSDLIAHDWDKLVTKLPSICDVNIKKLPNKLIPFPKEIQLLRQEFRKWRTNTNWLLPLSDEQKSIVLNYLQDYLTSSTKNPLLYDLNLCDLDKFRTYALTGISIFAVPKINPRIAPTNKSLFNSYQ
ncbi:MAG: hypothetical protein HKM04_05115, partial [Legionellales bacterium]|nr:hypothetical protein [Legionellales bacterium]